MKAAVSEAAGENPEQTKAAVSEAAGENPEQAKAAAAEAAGVNPEQPKAAEAEPQEPKSPGADDRPVGRFSNGRLD